MRYREKRKKLTEYFNRLNEENQDYVLAEMIELYRQQGRTVDSNYQILDEEDNIIFVDF